MEDAVSKSWYTKYRPTTMADYMGPSIKGIISKRFRKRENMPHVMFIHGDRGCGKTSISRIISKYYLCQNPNDDGTPCEQCEMCQSINEILIAGESSQVECPGVVELDATIMNGKDAIQEVLDDAIQAPIYSDYKVLIIDEVHMLSAAAQNSMLKIIEDIPQSLVIIFATTDEQKVLKTIKSRCQLMLEVRRQSVRDMAHRLMQISQSEGLTVSQEALEVIAIKGDRVPRECINLLETVAKTYDNEVTIDTVRDYLGSDTSDSYIGFFKAANSSLSDILQFVRKLKDKEVKYSDFLNGLNVFIMDALYIKHGISLEEYPTDYIKTIKELFDMYTSNEFDMLMQIILYATAKVSKDNNIKGETLLVTTAMRIGKVTLLANGLSQQQTEAITENKKSLYEHGQLIKQDKQTISEKLKVDLDIESDKEAFDNIKVVNDSQDILPAIELSEISTEEEKEKESETNNIGSEVDNFFDI